MEAQTAARVLVVDDEVRALRLMSRVLGSSAILCRTAESAAEAMTILKQAPELDVVVSDIYMPTTDGIEFLGAVRRDFVDRPWLQLLLVTGQASLETAVAAMRLEASDYLFKPIEPKSLRESVQHALTRAESIRTVRGTPGDSPGARELQQIADTAKALAADMRRTIEQDSGRRDGGSTAPAPRAEDSSLRTLKLL
jgi:DNA-binding NtrC family response regulator